MNLETTYMGLKLKSPIVPSASPLTRKLDNIRKLEDAGAAAIVMHSLFSEQILGESVALNHYMDHDAEGYAEAQSYFPDLGDYSHGPNEYLEHLSAIKKAVDVPVIASLNSASAGGWINYADSIAQTGVDGIELNVYTLPTDINMSGARVERIYLEVLSEVRRVTDVPIAMKLSPFFSSIPNMAKRLNDAGADALVLFNRFYQPDIDIEDVSVAPNLTLSTSSSTRLPMRWIAILYKKISASLAASSGVHTHEDIIKLLMAGADITMTTAALITNGPQYIAELESGLTQWLQEHEYESVDQLRGSLSHQNSPDPAVFERANYMRALHSVMP